MDQTKTNMGDESSEDIMNWGSPLNRPVGKMPASTASTSLDFLDEDDVKSDEEAFPIRTKRSEQVNSEVPSTQIATPPTQITAPQTQITTPQPPTLPFNNSNVNPLIDNSEDEEFPSKATLPISPAEETEQDISSQKQSEKNQSFTDFLTSESEEFDIVPREKTEVSCTQAGSSKVVDQGIFNDQDTVVDQNTNSRDIFDDQLIADQDINSRDIFADQVVTDQKITDQVFTDQNTVVDQVFVDQNTVLTDHNTADNQTTNDYSIMVNGPDTMINHQIGEVQDIARPIEDIQTRPKCTSQPKLGPAQTTKFQRSAFIKYAGETLLRYLKISSKRVSGNSIVDRPLWILESYLPTLPVVTENSFRYKTALEVADAPIKSLDKDYARIKSLLGLRDDPIFTHDLTLKIGAETLNNSLSDRNILFGSPEEIFSYIAAQGGFTPLEINVLRYKMGLSCSFTGMELPQQLLRQVLAINIPELNMAFIKQQPRRIVYILIFYKLGMLDGRAMAPFYSKNLFYRFLLSRAGMSSISTVKEDKGGWNMRSLVDFGISKILNVEKPKEYKSPLEHLQVSARVSDRMLVSDRVPVSDNIRSSDRVPATIPEIVNDRVSIPPAVSNPPSAISPETVTGVINNDTTAKPTVIPITDNDDLIESRKSIFDESNDDDLFDGSSTGIIEQPRGEGPIGETQVKPPINVAQSEVPISTNQNIVSFETQDKVPTYETQDKAPNDVIRGKAPTDVIQDEPQTDAIQDKAPTDDNSIKETAPPNQLYNKKFSKSFADIFTLESGEPAPESLDLSSYVPEVSNTDKPVFTADEPESKGSVISSLFGMFKKKPAEPKRATDDIMQARLSRPLKAAIQAPEKRERKVVQTSYANMKNGESVDIPGFKPTKK